MRGVAPIVSHWCYFSEWSPCFIDY